MSASISLEEIDFLARRAGLALTEAQKAELVEAYPTVAAALERIRTPRGHEAEPAHIFVPGAGVTP